MKSERHSMFFRFATTLLAGSCILWVAGCKGNESGRGAAPGEGATTVTATAAGRGVQSSARSVPAPVAAPPAKPSAASSDMATTASFLAADQSSTETLEAETTAADIPSTAPRLILSGRVTFAKDGSPAAGATVELTAVEGSFLRKRKEIRAGSARTDASGRYRLLVQDRPYFLVNVSRSGSARVVDMIQDIDAMRNQGKQSGVRKVTKDFVLPVASVLAGRVVDEHEQPVAGVKVVSYKGSKLAQASVSVYQTSSDTTSDSKGEFRFTDVEAGPVGLSIDSPDYVPLTQEATAPAEDVVLHLQSEGGSIGGHVYMKSTGQGVEGATAALFGVRKPPYFYNLGGTRTAVTDSTGAFRFDRLRAMDYRIQVWKDPLVQVTNKDPNASMISLGEKEKKTDLTYFLYGGTTVHGRVTLKDTGEPIEGAEVRAMGVMSIGRVRKKYSGITDGDGMYAIAGLSGNAISLTADKKGFALVRSSPYTNYVQVSLDPDKIDMVQDLQMTRATTVSGTVKTENGLPVPNAEVSLYSQDYMARQKKIPVKEDGTYSVDVPPFTSLRIKAIAPGYPMAVSDVVQVEDASVDGVDIVLKPGGAVAGRVTLPDGNPAAGASVQASTLIMYGNMGMSEPVGTATTDGSGRFTITDVPARDCSFSASEKGYAPSRSVGVVLSGGETKSDVELQLRTSHYIAGHVTDGDGNPIASANIWASAPVSGENSHGNARTDADGSYRIDGLAYVIHYVNVSTPDKGNDSKQGVEVDQDNVDFVLGSKSGVTLVGTVVDAATKQPIQDFAVGWDYGPANVEKDPANPGHFKLKNLQGGVSYSLRITATGYADYGGGYFTVPKGVKTFEKTFELGKGGTVTGRVIGKVSGAPLAGVHVYLRGTSNPWELQNRSPVAIVNTGDDGKFQFTNVSAGRNRVDFHPSPPLVESTRTADVTNDQTTDLGDVALTGGGVVNGKVVQDPGEIPIPGVEIELRESTQGTTQKKATTDANGAFQFTGMPAGSYSVYSSKWSLRSYFQLQDGATQEVVLHVGTATLKGRAMKGGKPIAVSVSLSKPGENMNASVQSEGNGTFEISGLSAGDYTVFLSVLGDWNTRLQEQVTLAAGQTVEKDFVFPNGQLVGRVVDGKDQPIVGAIVTARSPALSQPNTPNSTRQIQTEGDGTFKIDGLPAGTYSVSASKQDAGMASQDGIEVPSDGASASVELRIDSSNGGTVVSVALDMNAKPVKSAWCNLTPPGGSPLNTGATRDDNGTMKIVGVPAGTYRMEVSAWGYSVVTRTIEVKAGESQTFDDVLYEAGALRWTLTDGSGKNLPGVACKLVPNDATSIEEPRTGTTDGTGQFVVRGLYPGAYTGTASLSDGRGATETFTIEAHQLATRTTKIE